MAGFACVLLCAANMAGVQTAGAGPGAVNLQAPAGAAAATAPAAFDVASVRPNNSGSGNVSVNTNNTTFAATNVSLLDLLSNAYDIRRDIVFGLPDWAGAARFDVQAKVLDPAYRMKGPELQAMLQNLLADRFHVKAHVETRQLPVYDLVIAKGGPKFLAAAHPVGGEDVFHGVHGGGTQINNGHFIAHGITMDQLCRSVAGSVQRTVIDKTGLAGTYDFDWAYAQDYGGGIPADAVNPPVPAALQQQLGLKLEPSKGPVDTLVVDHAERPTEN